MNTVLWLGNLNDNVTLLPRNLTASVSDSFTIHALPDSKVDNNVSENNNDSSDEKSEICKSELFEIYWVNDGYVRKYKNGLKSESTRTDDKDRFNCWPVYTPLCSFQVTSVHCKYGVFGVVSSNNQVFMWGASDKGQCGCVERIVVHPRLVVIKTKDITCDHGCHEPGTHVAIEQLSFGRSLTLAVSPDGSLWSWGTLYPTEQDDNSAVLEPYQVPLTRKVINVACGEYHYLALAEAEFVNNNKIDGHHKGKVQDLAYSSFLDSCAQCAEEKEDYFENSRSRKFSEDLPFLTHKKQYLSSNFDDVSPFVCPLGLKLEFSDQIIENNQNGEQILTSSPINGGKNLPEKRRLIEQFSVESTNSFDQRERRNKNAATLPATASSVDRFTLATSIEMVEIRKAKSAGNRFSFISFDYNGTESSSSNETLTDCAVNNIVNDKIVNNFDDSNVTKRVRNNTKHKLAGFNGIALKRDNSTAVEVRSSVATEVWSWGSNEYGQLGLGDFIKRSQPSKIEKMNDFYVSKLDAGDYHSVALTSTGELFVWGSNLKGQIKQSNNARPTPELFKIGSQSSVLDVACGKDFTVLLVNNLDWKPEVYYCGKNYANNESTVDRLSHWTKVYAGWPICIKCCENFVVLPICPEDEDQQFLSKFYELLFTEIKFVQKIKHIQSFVNELLIKHFLHDFPFESEIVEEYNNALAQFCSVIVKSVTVMKHCLTLGSTFLAGNTKSTSSSSTSLFLSVPSSIDFSNSLKNLHTYYCQMVASNIFSCFKLNDDLETILRQLSSVNDIESSKDTRLLKKLFCIPFNRVKEYTDIAQSMLRCQSINQEDRDWLQDFIKHMKILEQFLCNVFVQSEKTHHFWTKYSGKSHMLCLKKSDRLLVKEYSRQNGINAIAEAKSSLPFQEVFIFNDSLAIVMKNAVKTFEYPLLWLVPVHDDSKFLVQIVCPETILSIEFSDGVSKNEFVQCVVQSLMRFLNGPYSETYPGNGPPLRRKGEYYFSGKSSNYCDATYIGSWVLGKPHGIGLLRYTDDRQFQGRFKDGLMHGFGEMRNGTETVNAYPIIRGYWKENSLTGLAIVNYGNGIRYEGYLKNGLRHGHGVLSRRSQTYFGAWENDKRCGYGVADRGKEKYLGMWENDKEHGCGCLVTLDAIYYEGLFDSGTFEKGNMLLQDGTRYEGDFNGIGVLNGKASIIFTNGDKVSGHLSGPVCEGVKISHGEYCRSFETPNNSPRNSGLILTSAHLVPTDKKWTDVFGHVYENLCGSTPANNTSSVWENLVSTLNRLRKLFDNQIRFKNVKSFKNDGLDTIPDWNRPFDESYYRMVKEYCLLALQRSYHPFGRLLVGLTDVFNASYSGVGAHPALLPQAIAEINCVVRRFYQLIRLLFPNLPNEYEMDKLIMEPSSDIYNNPNDFDTCSSFLYDCFLQQVYPTLFTLYVMQNDSIDGKFASRIKTLNARNDVALLDAFNVDKHLWPIRLAESIRDSNVLDTPLICATARSKYYADAIECLQRLSSEFYPSAKLKVIVDTFYHINECVSQFSSESTNHMWSADSLVPVTMYVVVRAQIQRLGAEIRLIEDFSPQLQYLGQVQYLLATLQGCYKHVVEDKNLF